MKILKIVLPTILLTLALPFSALSKTGTISTTRTGTISTTKMPLYVGRPSLLERTEVIELLISMLTAW